MHGEGPSEQTPPSGLHRTVYFVRHAESTWNAGNRRRNLFMLMRHVDHPLSTVGVGQAQALSEALQCSLMSAASTGSQSMMDAALAPLGSAAEVWASPATRCMQTSTSAMCAASPLLGHPSGAAWPRSCCTRSAGARDSARDLRPPRRGATRRAPGSPPRHRRRRRQGAGGAQLGRCRRGARAQDGARRRCCVSSTRSRAA